MDYVNAKKGDVMNRISNRFIVSVFLLITGLAATAYATSYPILEHSPQRMHETEVMKEGTIVYLFHSGVPNIRDKIESGDILPVYREDPCCKVIETGKIKVFGYAGKNYIKAEMVQGEIKPGDMAKKGALSFLIIVFGCDCK
jgi:hypothetical protein